MENLVNMRLEQEITWRGWKDFCSQPSVDIVSVVKKFYANLLEQQDYQVYVWGKMVKFDSATINGLFKLPNIPWDEYHQYLEQHLNLNKVLAYLTILSIVWKYSKEGSATFSTKAIAYEETKAWYYFLSTLLMLISHLSDVTQEWAILL